MELKHPIQLLSSIRDWNDLPVAFAATKDGGEVAVFWNNKTSNWVVAADMAGVTLKSPSMDKEISDLILKTMIDKNIS